MSETELEEGLASAASRFDRALARLSTSVRDLNMRLQRQQRMDVDTQRLIHERARLATELDKTAARASWLDDSAHEVSRRLVVAMETVRSVLEKAE